MDSQKLAPAQLAIIQHLYRFRFLTSLHIQSILKQKTIRLTYHHLQILTKT